MIDVRTGLPLSTLPMAVYQRERNVRLRAAALDAYGGVCACCGESRSEFLGIDHIGGRDRASPDHYLPNGRRVVGVKLYDLLRRLGYPKEGYRLLCHNCNLSRGFYGYCPHERERVEAG